MQSEPFCQITFACGLILFLMYETMSEDFANNINMSSFSDVLCGGFMQKTQGDGMRKKLNTLVKLDLKVKTATEKSAIAGNVNAYVLKQVYEKPRSF